jgi:hypothetical protein
MLTLQFVSAAQAAEKALKEGETSVRASGASRTQINDHIKKMKAHLDSMVLPHIDEFIALAECALRIKALPRGLATDFAWEVCKVLDHFEEEG